MQFLTKYKHNIFLRYTISLAVGVALSVLLNDIPIIANYIKTIIGKLNYNMILTRLTLLNINLTGINAHLTGSQIIVGDHSFYFDYGCLGIRHIALFIGFIATYFGKPLQKLIYILVGIVVLTVANISRATLIGIAINFNYSLFDFVHEYGTIIILYGSIFILWTVWDKKVNIT